MGVRWSDGSQVSRGCRYQSDANLLASIGECLAVHGGAEAEKVVWLGFGLASGSLPVSAVSAVAVIVTVVARAVFTVVAAAAAVATVTVAVAATGLAGAAAVAVAVAVAIAVAIPVW